MQTLVEQWKNGQLVLPDIQREYVWDNAKASRLIESLLLNIPIPVLYFAETEEAKYEIFDGHQRVASIVRYFNGLYSLSGLAVLREYRGLRYSELPERERRFLTMRTLRTILISIDSAPTMKFEIYERLNTGSISLNAQELRNPIYRGPFNDMLHELTNFPPFRGLIATRQPRRRMVDEEAILRFFAMRAGIGVYRTPLKKFLNVFMAQVRHSSADQISEYARVFHYAVHRAATLWGICHFAFLIATANPKKARSIARSSKRSFLPARGLSLTRNQVPSWSKKKWRVCSKARISVTRCSARRVTERVRFVEPRKPLRHFAPQEPAFLFLTNFAPSHVLSSVPVFLGRHRRN